MTMRVQSFRRGVRLVQHGSVLSEVLRAPGPTHSVFDLLAAAAVAFSPGPRMAMLGFAGGGMMAPLRFLGGRHQVEAVDLDGEGHQLYRRVVGDWGEPLEFAREDAVVWLRGRRKRFDVIIEDLSVPLGKDVVKPAVSWDVLPSLMVRRIRAEGVLISNLLPTPAASMKELERRCRQSSPACVVEFDRFYNRVLIQGANLGSAREVGAQLRRELSALGSRLGVGIRVRSLRP